MWSDRERREFFNRLESVDPNLAAAVQNAEPVAFQNGQSSFRVIPAENLASREFQTSNSNERSREICPEDAEVQGINLGPESSFDHFSNGNEDEKEESSDLALTD